ncbi:unnamed protein product [Cuscuta europaea]|uniref:TmcB/TmcC TPR repeats domain-containing protein n=1 Tax=Cuscuta europaea TaxID=41803 RepID=A0A9P1EBU1_CUSEU|nr:unnamed protein product [Cuscuta europaea]
MLLRSSSTPILGSLLPDTATNHHHHPSEIVTPTHHHQFKKFLCTNHTGSRKFSCNSSPNSPSPSVSDISSRGFRKVLSDGNLERLAVNDDHHQIPPCNVIDEFTLALPIKKFSRIGLETIPSFSFRRSRSANGDEEIEEVVEEGEEEDEDEEEDIGGAKHGLKVEMGLKVAEERTQKVEAGREMCGVRGNGVAEGGSGCDCGGGCGGGGGGQRPVDFYRGGGDNNHGFSLEEHYKKMMEENPSNPLFLRNYAQFLYQTKGDFEGAEEYYSRAILADPNDGEVLSQYAKLVWELHHDAERATTYFQCAVQAASQDSNVHAAYAKFLWEVDDDEDDEENDEEQTATNNRAYQPKVFQPGPVPSATAC